MADVDEIVTGKRREGSFAGVMTFVRKLSQSAAVVLVTQLMQASGFVSKSQVQTPEALAMIVGVLGIGTLALLAFGVFVAARVHLDPRTHDVLMEEIERLRAGDPTPPSPEHRAVVEDLSGWRYEQLWGNNPVAGKR
jgi:oligogalacturonide transporter